MFLQHNFSKRKKSKIISAFTKDVTAWVLILPSLFLIYFLVLRPQILGFYWSFFEMRGFTPLDFIGLDNYKRVLTDTVFMKTFLNTWKYVLWSLTIGFVIPFVIAIIMNEIIHFRKIIRTVVYFPTVMPIVAVSMLWYFMYFPDASGLLNTFLAKVGIEPYVWLQDPKFTILYIVISMTWSSMGSTAIYYFSVLQGLNRELYEAAMMDGAGFFRRIRVVTIPHMSGILSLFFVRQIISVFSVMEWPMQMTDGGPDNASLSLGLLNYRYAFMNGRPQLALAQGVVMFLILSVFTVLYFYINKRLEENQM